MYVALDIDNIKLSNIIVTEAMHNTVIDNSSFMRIMYSEPNVSFNGLYVKCDLVDSVVERYFNKYKCTFDRESNRELIDRVRRFEENILACVRISGKRRCCNLVAQLNSGFVKIFTDSAQAARSNEILLKVSGIWESEQEYGITYKFLISNRGSS